MCHLFKAANSTSASRALRFPAPAEATGNRWLSGKYQTTKDMFSGLARRHSNFFFFLDLLFDYPAVHKPVHSWLVWA